MRKSYTILTVALVALAAVALSGCGDMLDFFAAPTLTVINARTGDGIGGATITLTPISGEDGATTVTATSTSSGYVNFGNVTYGKYTVSGTLSGYAFVPRTVEVNGYAVTLPDLLGYVSPGADQILLITQWDNENIDVDVQLVVDTVNTDTLLPDSSTTAVLLGPLTASNDTMTGLILENDTTVAEMASGLPAVETIRISSNPFADSDNVGWLRLYLYAYNVAGGLTGNSAVAIKEAGALVHVMQGTTHLGTFKVATETEETMICVAKIAVTYPSSVTTYSVMSPGNFSNTAKSIR